MPGPKKPSAYMAFVERYRAWLVCFGVLPTSSVLKVVEKLTRWLTAPAPEDHEARVQRVCSEVQRWASLPAGERRPMCTDRSSSYSHSVRLTDKSGWHRITMGDLRAILSLEQHQVYGNEEATVVRVEPGVTVSEISKFLLTHKLQLECTLEMEDATIGGLAAATGMTTHSHVCGLIHDTIVAWEVVTAAGEAIVATATNEHAALFHALPFSHGSLGLIVGLTLRCVPSRPFVRLTYTPFTSRKAFIEKYEAVAYGGSAPPFYVEAIVFSPESAVLMEGVLVDGPTATAPLNNIGAHWKPWFYTRVRDVLTTGGGVPVTETLPMYDYLMRHDRSMCMTMETVMPFGNDAWFRYPFGWTLPPKMSMLKASHNDETREASIRKQIYQDVAFPATKLSEAIDLSDRLFGIFPLLCYPCRMRDVEGRMVRSGTGSDVPCFNLGIYGVPQALRQGKAFKTVHAVRELEAWIRGVHGFQHTYCDSFQTKEEFEDMFDLKPNAALRKKYGAEGAFVGVYEKTRPEMDVWAWKAEEETWTE